MGANDDDVLDWIGPVKELIRDAVAEQRARRSGSASATS